MKIRIRLLIREGYGPEPGLPLVTLCVRDKYTGLAELTFIIDTAADFTTIPVRVARREGIPINEGSLGKTGGLAGVVEAYRAEVRIVIAGREHSWPCNFTKDPEPRQAGQAGFELSPVLGRAGFLDEYAVSIDSGFLLITRLGPLRRWWRRCLHILWDRRNLIWPAHRPL